VARKKSDPFMEALRDTQRLTFVARNHGIPLAQLRREIDAAMRERRDWRALPFDDQPPTTERDD
jgi:hypothetical protein